MKCKTAAQLLYEPVLVAFQYGGTVKLISKFQGMSAEDSSRMYLKVTYSHGESQESVRAEPANRRTASQDFKEVQFQYRQGENNQLLRLQLKVSRRFGTKSKNFSQTG